MNELLEAASLYKTIVDQARKKYGLIYLSTDKMSIIATKGNSSMTFYEWDEEPKIKSINCPTEIPGTFEEFDKLKKEKEEDDAVLLKIAEEWREATGKNDE